MFPKFPRCVLRNVP